MSNILGIGVLVLTGILWVLYHKIFRVIYFGSMGRSIFKELFGCFIVAALIMGLIGTVGGSVLGFAGGVLGWLLSLIITLVKWALILGVIGGAIYLVYSLVTRKKKSPGDTMDTQIVTSESEQDTNDKQKSEQAIDTKTWASTMETVSQADSSEITGADVINSEGTDEQNIEQNQLTDMKFCSFCGKKISKSQRFCNFCGKECVK